MSLFINHFITPLFCLRQINRRLCDNILYVKTKGGMPTERIIYGDVLLVINFSMDFLSLYITAKIMHIKLNSFRITSAAVIGALYSLFILGINASQLVSALFSIAFSFLMCSIAYGKFKFARYIKNTSVFYIVNFALGGGITAICNLLNMWKNNKSLWINGTYDVLYGDIPFGLLLVLACFCGALSLFSGKIIKKQKSIKTAEIEIVIQKQNVLLTALIDSGNLLREPISGKAVIVACYSSLRSVIPTELLDLFKNQDISTTRNEELLSKLRLIPTHSVGKNGLLFALLPDSVKVNGNPVDAYVAVDTAKNSYGEYQAIIPSALTE